MAKAIQYMPWLRRPPSGFRDLCKKFRSDGENPGWYLRSLSDYALDDNELHLLAKVVSGEKNRTGNREVDGLQKYRLGVISNGTTKLITPCLVATAIRYGIDLTVIDGEFNQVVQEALSPTSKINVEKPDAVLIALDYRGIPGLDIGFANDESKAVNEALAFIEMICRGVSQAINSTIIVQNIPCPPMPLFGGLDARLSGSQRRRIDQFNEGLSTFLGEVSGILFDVDGLARNVGYENWFKPQQWHIAKLAFSQIFSPIYADHCMRLIGSVRGVSRKCLVLDLDNTLWGGVVGDDGLAGITIGQGNPVGEAYLAIQQVAKHLRERGIMLAVCSKNDDSIARAVFREHPDMLLREEDISVFQANWKDKASNLEAIAATLNIATNAIVFLDDNPAEREQVRQALPEVAVPELPDDPASYPFLLLAAGYFESVSFTDDDRRRANQYLANAERAELAQSSRDINDYLSSLKMEASFSPFDTTGRSRIAQLVSRSNQFNLTTHRYDETAIAKWEQNTDAFTLQVRLADRFGDNGMVSIVICVRSGEYWIIDTWLMSCRVLNRRVEEAVLDTLVANAKSRGICQIIGHYIPTGRNGLVKDHYFKLGFVPTKSDNSMEAWVLDLASYVPKKPPMQCVFSDKLVGY
jgi:FkbH-like protein